MEKKKKLKAMFDADYDEVDGSGGSKHYDELKKEVDQQTMVSGMKCNWICFSTVFGHNLSFLDKCCR